MSGDLIYLHCWVLEPRYNLETPWPRCICLNSPMMVSKTEQDNFFTRDYTTERTIFGMGRTCDEACLYGSSRGTHVPYIITFPKSKLYHDVVKYRMLTIDTRNKPYIPYESLISVSYSFDYIEPCITGFQYLERIISERTWFMTQWLIE